MALCYRQRAVFVCVCVWKFAQRHLWFSIFSPTLLQFVLRYRGNHETREVLHTTFSSSYFFIEDIKNFVLCFPTWMNHKIMCDMHVTRSLINCALQIVRDLRGVVIMLKNTKNIQENVITLLLDMPKFDWTFSLKKKKNRKTSIISTLWIPKNWIIRGSCSWYF